MNQENTMRFAVVSQLMVAARTYTVLATLMAFTMLLRPSVANADFSSTANVAYETPMTRQPVTRQTIELARGIQVHTVSVQLPFGLTRVSLSNESSLAGIHHKLIGGEAVVGNLHIKQNQAGVVLTGWRAIRINSHSVKGADTFGESTQLQRILLQEIRITLPHSVSAGGWDVRSLERELERLGVKVKPKPSMPKPTTQLSG